VSLFPCFRSVPLRFSQLPLKTSLLPLPFIMRSSSLLCSSRHPPTSLDKVWPVQPFTFFPLRYLPFFPYFDFPLFVSSRSLSVVPLVKMSNKFPSSHVLSPLESWPGWKLAYSPLFLLPLPGALAVSFIIRTFSHGSYTLSFPPLLRRNPRGI